MEASTSYSGLSGDISAKVLAAEWKELETNSFTRRQVFTGTPVTMDYELTQYAGTLTEVPESLDRWGEVHRETVKHSIKEGKGVAI